MYVNNVTADTFSHVSNTQTEKANAIFTSEKLDKYDELIDAVNNLTINDTEYYESNTVTVNETQDDITRNLATVTHNSNINEIVTHTIIGKFEKYLLSNCTIPGLPLAMNPGIDQCVASIVLTPHTLLSPVTKEVVADAALGGTWISRTPRQISRTGFNGITPGDICNAIIVVEPPFPFLIAIVSTSLSCGFNTSQQVANKWQFPSPVLVGQTQKLDAVVDGKFPNDLEYASIFRKVIGHKLSDGYNGDLYTPFRVNIVDDSVQT